jgi:hypothetical protein
VTDFPAGYRAHHTFRELRTELEALASLHPTLVELRSMGRSYEGRKLFVVKISDNVAANEAEPEIYVDGGTHGHEHLSTEQALAMIHWLVDGYGTDPRTTAIVDSTVAPMINPDGATYDVAGGAFKQWRKNRKPYGGAIGADINRTFGYRWGGAGSSGDPANAFYRGPRPWTAPEARRVRDFVLSRVIGGEQRIQSALTIHSHGEFVMFPFGWTKESEPVDMRPGDRACLSALANGIAARNGYRPTQAGKLYRSSGTFMDLGIRAPADLRPDTRDVTCGQRRRGLVRP